MKSRVEKRKKAHERWEPNVDAPTRRSFMFENHVQHKSQVVQFVIFSRESIYSLSYISRESENIFRTSQSRVDLLASSWSVVGDHHRSLVYVIIIWNDSLNGLISIYVRINAENLWIGSKIILSRRWCAVLCFMHTNLCDSDQEKPQIDSTTWKIVSRVDWLSAFV